jgi:hypothetical protein
VAIFEVLPRDASSFQVVTRWDEYRKVKSLRHYVAVEQQYRAVYHWSPSGRGRSFAAAEGEDVVRLTALKIELPLSEIYEGVRVKEFGGPNSQRRAGRSRAPDRPANAHRAAPAHGRA